MPGEDVILKRRFASPLSPRVIELRRPSQSDPPWSDEYAALLTGVDRRRVQDCGEMLGGCSLCFCPFPIRALGTQGSLRGSSSPLEEPHCGLGSPNSFRRP